MADVETRSWSGPGPRPTRNELLAIVGIIFVYGLIAAWLIADGVPLGHDESVYALKSRHLQLGGTSAWYWNDFRAPGLPILLQITWLVSGTEPFLRASIWVFGALGVGLTWLIGRSLFDRRSGLLAAAGLSLTAPWLTSSTLLWPDIPGAVFGLGAIAVILFSTERDRASWWVLAAAPLALAAVLVRYGAPIPMGIGSLAVMIWRRRTVLRSLPQFASLGSLVGIGTALILLVPSITGAATSPYSSLRALRAANPLSLTRGINDYIKQADFILGGYAGLLLITGFALAALYALRDRQDRSTWLFLLTMSATTAVVLALILHGEYRYLSPVYPLVWIIAGWGLAEASRRLPRESAWIVGLVLAVLVPINAASHGGEQTELLADRFGDLRLVSRAIDAQHGYEDCGIITSYIPQVAWYTECVTQRFEPIPVLTSPFFAEPQADYMLLLTGGKRQPKDDTLEAYLDATTGVFAESGDPNGGSLEYAIVYLIED